MIEDHVRIQPMAKTPFGLNEQEKKMQFVADMIVYPATTILPLLANVADVAMMLPVSGAFCASPQKPKPRSPCPAVSPRLRGESVQNVHDREVLLVRGTCHVNPTFLVDEDFGCRVRTGAVDIRPKDPSTCASIESCVEVAVGVRQR